MTRNIDARHLAVASVYLLAVLLAGAALGLAAVGSAAGQEAGNNSTASTGQGGEVVTDGLVVTDKRYVTDRGNNGTLLVTFQAEEPTAVTLYDAGAFGQGGPLPSRTAVVEGNATVAMPVTTVGGRVGVNIVTDDVVYALPVTVSSDSSTLPASPGNLPLLGLGGLASLVVMVGWHKRDQRLQEGGVSVVE